MTIKVLEINATTGIKKTRDMTALELSEFNSREAENKLEATELDKAQKANLAKKVSGRNKLLALGLTEAEVTALVG